MTLIQDLKQLEPKILLYSHAGGGKSAFMETLGRRLQIIDLDPGAHVGLSIYDQWRDRRLSCDVVRIRDADPSRAVAWEAVKKTVQNITNQVNAGTYPYQFLAVDSLTSMGELALRSVLGNSGNANNPQPNIQQWGIAINEIKNLLIYLRALKIPVILSAHCQTTLADSDNKMGIAIFGRDLPNYIPRFFDEIWYMHCRAVPTPQNQPQKYTFTLQTQPSASIMARSRLGVPNEFDCSAGFDAALTAGNYHLLPYPETQPTTTNTP
jgi:hypothetical protein